MIKSREITLLTKVCISSHGFPSICVQLWELGYKEGWVPKNWRFRTVVLQETPERPSHSKIKPVNLKGKEGEMYTESIMEICNTICKIDGQWEFAVRLRELKQGLCDNLEGWDGEWDGMEVREGGDTGVNMADSCWWLTESHKIL